MRLRVNAWLVILKANGTEIKTSIKSDPIESYTLLKHRRNEGSSKPKVVRSATEPRLVSCMSGPSPHFDATQ